jgi:hypothetical protein
LDADDSGLIVIGFDKGDGLAILFAASEDEARGGIFTSRGTSVLMAVCSARELVIGEGEDWAGFPGAMDDPVASRLLA